MNHHQSVGQLKRTVLLQKLRQLNNNPKAENFTSHIRPADRSQPLPLSWAQQRLWFLAQLDAAASQAYHIPAGLRLHGQLDKLALIDSLNRIVARHEVLRTTFVGVDGEPRQIIASSDNGFTLLEHDLRGLASEAQSQTLAQICQDEISQAFDLAAGPLIRGRLLQLTNNEHVLLITQHHIISDGWSIGRLINEFSTLYTAFSQGQADPLPALTLQYADYAVWQRQWLRGEALQAQIDFWKDQLAGAPELLELPTDFPRPAQQSYVGAGVDFTLPSELSAQLKHFSQRHNVTLFMTLLTAWSVLMARLSGCTDVVIGTPVANRAHADLESLIGFFVNTLALRVRLNDEPSTAQLLERVKATTLADYTHQDLPFEQLVEAVKPTRSMSHSPLFQVMLALNNTPNGGELSLPGLTLSAQELEQSTTQFDLSLSVTDLGDVIVGNLHYASDLFTAETINRLTGYFQTLLVGMLEDDQQAVSRLPLLSTAETRQLLIDFNATETDFPQHFCIHQLFEQQVEQTPNAIALVYEDKSLNYDQLNRRANRLAHHLIDLGIHPDDRVAICVERSLEMVIGLLGILKAGGAYVPLDPSYPKERLAYMLADCAPVALLTQQALLAESALFDERLQVPVILLDVLDDQADAVTLEHNPDPTALGLTSQHLAYVIYTSGSTGQPKGVMNQHQGVVNRLWWAQNKYHFNSSDRILQKTPYTFDVSVWEFFSPLLAGAQLIIAKPKGHQDPQYLAQIIASAQITAIHFVPSMLPSFLDQVVPQEYPELLRVFVSGEALPHTLQMRFHELLQHVDLHNHYGPTEAAIEVTFYHCRPEHLLGFVPIGYPIANTQMYILDAYLQPVPLGVTGELYIGGAGVARGYLGRPELTSERFIDNPFRKIRHDLNDEDTKTSDHQFGRSSSPRLYKTGDLGRWLPDGSIEYLGRNDFQVKIRGFRIELGEIEAQLSLCAGVREAVVIAREDVPGDKRLVAYLLADVGQELSAADLRCQLSASLADYMLPSAFVTLDAFPLTPNGKLDRKALPAPDGSAVITRPYQAPQGSTETLIAEIWKELLHLDRVGRYDQFFELGGHSLLAVQLVAQVRQTLGIELALRELFAYPVLADLVQAVNKAQRSELPTIAPADRSQPLPLSWAQQRLWFLAQLDAAASQAYHIPVGLRLHGQLDKLALVDSLNRIVARHEVLRTTFVGVDGEPRQIIASSDNGFTLLEHDLRGLASEAQSQTLAQICQDEISQAFDLAAGPLIRGRLLQLTNNEHVLLITQHHIISDGWSIGRLINEFSTLYTAFSQGQADPLPALTLQYADYAVWQRQWLQGEVLQAQIDFWKDQLAGAPELLELPTDFQRPAQQSYAGAGVDFTLSSELTTQLKHFSQRHNVTLFMTLLTAWSVLMARLSGCTDVVIGTSIANRPNSELEKLVGLFINTLALRVQLDDDPSTSQLLEQVKATTLAAYAHQDLPFEQLVEAVKPTRSMSHSPIFQVSLTLNNTPTSDELMLPGLTLSSHELKQHTTQFDLNLTLAVVNNIITGHLQYSTDLFALNTIEHLVSHYESLLGNMLTNEQLPFSQLPLLSETEKQHLLIDFNPTSTPYENQLLIHQLFENQASKTPEAIAIICDNRSINYFEVNSKANQLANHIKSKGITPDTIIGLYIDRSIEMLIGMLGILKSGCAYLPLDPDYPQERTAYMLEDSQTPIVLTMQKFSNALANNAINIVFLDENWPEIERYQSKNLIVPTHPLNLAYVIYTSGSTGKPKGVLISHQNVVHSTMARFSSYQEPLQSYLLLSSFAFDSSVAGIFWTLSQGGILYLPSLDIIKDPSQLGDLINKHQISHLLALPSLYGLILDRSSSKLGSLKTVIVAGESCPVDLVKRHYKTQAHVRLYNEYGPTEGTVWSSHYLINNSDQFSPSISIGRPINNVKIYILDQHYSPVPIGTPGEVYIGGEGIARGYLNSPELTSAKFIADPFSNNGDRLYRTGDLARFRSMGDIEFLGRLDDQVKIRGFRIELGEIEAQLNCCPGVRDVAVIAREEHSTGMRLVAYIVAEENQQLSAADLRTQLSTVLPDYMLPSAFVLMESLPLTPNGKLDRKALPAPDDSAVITQSYEMPQGKTESTIVDIWQEIFHLERIGRHDNFFELGGHSLLATEMISRLSDKYETELPIILAFQAVTIKKLAEKIDLALWTKDNKNECLLIDTDLESGEI